MVAYILQKILDTVFTPCMEEGESYSHRARKMASIVISIIASPALFLGVPVTVLSALYEPSIGAYIMGMSMVSVVLTSSIFPYVYLRRTSKLPDWLVDFQIWLTVPVTLAVSLFSHHSSVSILCSVTVFLGIIMRVRGWQLLVLYGLFANVSNALIGGYSEELPALHEIFYSPQMLAVRIMFLIGGNLMPLLSFCVGLHAVMMEFVEKADQADAAIRMCVDVAGKLRRYDTEAVGLILVANQGKVDANLLEAFSGIQCNLQDYRPHIPDYVIANSTIGSENSSPNANDDEDDEDEGVVSDMSISPTPSHTSSYIHTNDYRHHSPDMGNVVRDVTPTGRFCRDEVFSVSSEPQSALSLENSSYGRRLKPSQQQPGSESLTSSAKLSEHRRSSNPQAKKRHHFYGRATTVFVRFVAQSCGSDGSGNGFVQKGNVNTAMDVLSKCLEAASQHAKTHGGALQYMQGCGLMVSFNAASRVLSYEASACAFALNLKAAIDEQLGGVSQRVVMHASIVTSHVLSFFAGNGGQLMLTVLGGFMPQHAAIHHYLGQTVGPASSCVVMNHSVIPAIEMVFEHRLLGGFSLQPNTPIETPFSAAAPSSDDGTTSIYQLTRSRTPTTAHEEWMYHAATHESNDPVYEAVRSVLDGELVDPSTIRSYCADDIVLTKCVLDRLEMCARGDGTFITTVVPTILW